MKTEFSLTVVRGVSGLCVYLNDYRIVGEKPWGGGTITNTWKVSLKDIVRALRGAVSIVADKAIEGER